MTPPSNIWTENNIYLPDCGALGDVDLNILPLKLRVRVDYVATRNTSDDSLYILCIIAVADVPTIL